MIVQPIRSLLLLLVLLGGSATLYAQVADFTANRFSGCAPFPLVISFQNLSTGADQYRWDFGDPGTGNTSTVQNPTFTYSGVGCFDVTLIATNSTTGLSDTLVQTCFIEIFPQPVVDLTVNANQGCAPFTVDFSDNSTPNAGAITSWQWTVSDGSSATGPTPSITFNTAPDTLDVVLTVTNSNGCTNFARFFDLIIVNEPPQLDFAADVVAACDPPLTVNFTNNSNNNGAGNPNYIWSFPGGTVQGGDSTFNGINPPPVTYNAEGEFDVSLILDDPGCSDTLVQTNLIGIGGVTADFSVDNTVICLGDSLTFTSLSTGGVTTLGWDFGEVPGIDASGDIETYVYSNPGTYTVTLYANNVDCGDTLVQTNLIEVQPIPTASFSVDRNEDCEPGNPFTFTDQSTNAASLSWDFGDGNTSTQPNPVHTYTALGEYVVCLTVTNALGCENVFCDTISIEAPRANFRRNPEDGCAPLTVNFTDISQSNDPIVSWDWLFAGGTNPNVIPQASTDQNPAGVQFNAPGVYSARLIIETASGCRDTAFIGGAVEAGEPPVGGFTTDDDTVCINQPVTFTADSANDSWEYLWDFMYESPGNFSPDSSVAFTAYPDTGTFSVAMVVRNNGCDDTTIIEDLIFVSPPRAQFTLSDTLVCSLPAPVAFTDEALGPVDIYEWSVDGTFYSDQATPPDLTINAIGTYVVQQVVTNSASGCSDTFQVVINAGNPVANFTGVPTQICRGDQVQFNNTTTDATASIWRLGIPGNQFASLRNPLYTFPDTGSYDIALIMRDALGCRDTLVRPDYITVVGPYAEIAADPTGGCPPLPVQFADSSTTFGTTISGWSWDFGDGIGTSTQQNPTYTFVDRGTYDISLTVTDNFGCTDSVTAPLVQVTFPEPLFSVDDSSTCAGNLVEFLNNSNGTGLTYLWDFGDGDTSSLANPTHAFSDTGYYDVTLVATDVNGCVDSLRIDSAVYIEPFGVEFSGTPRIGICPPLTTTFSDSTFGNVVSWRWDFGDGFGFSSLQNPVYIFFQPGDFDVALIATHEDGCQDTLLKPAYVQVAGPTGDFAVEPEDICLGDSVCLTANTIGAVRATIDFRDGNAFTFTGLSGLNDTLTSCHLYQNADTYSPVVILEDAQGCVFEVTSPDRTSVYALPQAQIAPLDSAGCLPMAVPFLDNTLPGDTTIATWNWSFGNGDTSGLQNPVYTYTRDSLYTVSLVVEDENGCVDSTSTTARARQGVIADFEASSRTGCIPIEIGFTDLSSNEPPVSWRWDFGDGATATDQNPSHPYTSNGNYTVTLIVEDAFGCTDTLVREEYVNLRFPEAVVYSDISVGCNPVDITFFADSSFTDTTLAAYSWCLTDINTGQEVCNTTGTGVDSLVISFTDPGVYEMVLSIEDIFGCADTSESIPVDISNRVTPEPIEMRNVTVRSDTSIEVTWTAYPGGDFVEYAIYRLNGPNAGLVATLTDQTEDIYVESNPLLDASVESYCYEVLVQNNCGEYSLPEETVDHCTVELEATPELNAVELNWSAYVGYQVGEYQIFRAESYDLATLTLIGSVPGNVLTFIDDETFCRDSITYRVLAIGFGGGDQQSFSDLSSSLPLRPLPDEATDVITATVVDDEFAELSWTEYTGTLPGDYLVERSNDGLSWDSLAIVPLGTRTYQDLTALVDTASYFYRVFNLDQCGDRSAEGRFGKTILLNANLDATGRTPVLDWTAYRQWTNGVLNYEIEVFNDALGDYEGVDNSVPANQLNYRDILTQLEQPTYCYRVRAYEVAGNGAESVSNEKCVTFGPAIFAPNAFTPNNDGVNQEFQIFAPNAQQVELIIYNRWGRVIFQTNDLSVGWNGTFKGAPVQEGVYVYRLTGIGVDGSSFERSGTVTLIR